MSENLTFAQRMALRKKAIEEGTAPSEAPTLVAPVDEPPVVAPLPQAQPNKPLTFAERAALRATGAPAPAPTPAALQTAPTPEPTPEPVVEATPAPLPKVIQAFNVAGAAKQESLGASLSGMPPKEAVKLIQQKIVDLQTAEGASLRYEMDALSVLLTANPEACLYLLDEDLGLAVRALRRMTDNRVARDLATARPSKAAKAAKAISNKPLTAEEMAAAMADL